MVAPPRRWWMMVILALFLLAVVIALLWWAFSRFTNTPSSTLLPTEQPTASADLAETAAPTPTAAPKSVPTIVTTPTTVSTPIPIACIQAPAPRWANTLYAEFSQQLGCPVTGEISTSASEIPANGAFQYYERGTMVWRQHADIIYVLYDDGSYVAFPDDSPDNYYETDFLKGGFGYLWNTNQDVRGFIGNPLTIEYAAADFTLQDFESGTIFYFNDNGGQNYVLFANPATWLLRQE